MSRVRGALCRSAFLLAALFFSIHGVLGEENAASPQQSFASFAYFIDKLQFPVKKIGQVWATPLSVYEGPFFTNDQLHIYLPPHYFDEARSPFFRGPVSTAASSIVYYDDYGPVDAAGHVNQRHFDMVFRSEVKTGVPKISLPAEPDESVKEAAFGGTVPAKMRGSGLLLPHDLGNRLTGGIVFNGSPLALTFDASPGENFKIIFLERKKTTAVEVDPVRDATLVSSPGEKTLMYAGVPNGAIYVNGIIGTTQGLGLGLSGRVKGRWTVATPADIFITDSLLYSDTSAGSSPTGKDCLALVARSVFITKDAPDVLYLYATVFAARQEGKEKLGTLFVMPNKDIPHIGELFWWGNYIGEYPAIMGTFDRATGESKDGYTLHKYYDDRLTANPPPYFPVIEPEKTAATVSTAK